MRSSYTRAWRIRALALLAAVIWTFGPLTPLALCSLSSAIAAQNTPSMPDCHGHKAQVPQQSAHPCCADIDSQCCLQAATVTGAVSVAPDLVRNDQVTAAPPCVPVIGVRIGQTRSHQAGPGPPGALFRPSSHPLRL